MFNFKLTKFLCFSFLNILALLISSSNVLAEVYYFAKHPIQYRHSGETTDLEEIGVIIASTTGAFAILQKDGSVTTYGSWNFGYNTSGVEDKISSGVKNIFSTNWAFAALKKDGSVVSWGDPESGGDSSVVTDKLQSGVRYIFSTDAAFTALKKDGSVVSWGNPEFGGDSSAVSTKLTKDVVNVIASSKAFSAIKKDGSIVTWGDTDTKDNKNFIQPTVKLIQVSKLVSNTWAFAAINKDGSVVSWGNSKFGGDSSSVKEKLKSGVVDVYSLGWQFAAVKKDGSVVIWGDTPEEYKSFVAYYKGKVYDNSGAQYYSNGTWKSDDMEAFFSTALPKGVVSIVSNGISHAALKEDGSVATWGEYSNASTPLMDDRKSGSLDKDVISIVANDYAFAALKNDGSVIPWGDFNKGGLITDFIDLKKNLSKGVIAITAVREAFAALKYDGSVIIWGKGRDYRYPHAHIVVKDLQIAEAVWGDADHPGVKEAAERYSKEPPLTSGIMQIFTTGGTFGALREDGSFITF